MLELEGFIDESADRTFMGKYFHNHFIILVVRI